MVTTNPGLIFMKRLTNHLRLLREASLETSQAEAETPALSVGTRQGVHREEVAVSYL
jgi:hypothetical protein